VGGITSHSLGRNAVALTVMQVSNYIAPLLVVPYLTRVLGTSMFGTVAVTLAAIQFIYVITDFGFSLSATRDIALNSGDKRYVANKISAVWSAKIFLLAIGGAVLILAPRLVGRLHMYAPFFLAAIPAVFAMAFQPIWFFLGVQRMKNVTIYMVATKALYVVLVLLLVHSSADALRVVYCWGGAQLLGLAVSVHLVFAEGYRIGQSTFGECVHELKASAQFFWSRLSVAAYTTLNTVIIGTLGAVPAAHYSVCEQAFNAGKSVTAPVNTALYPYMTKHKDWRLFTRLLIVIGTILAVGCSIVGIFAGPLLGFVFGQEYAASAPVLAVFCAVVFINYFGVTFGYAAFSALEKVHIANVSVVWGAVLQIIIIAVLYQSRHIDPFTMALGVLATETFVMLFRVFYFLKYVSLAKPTWTK
jgi:PST family polysaccharide transporter